MEWITFLTNTRLGLSLSYHRKIIKNKELVYEIWPNNYSIIFYTNSCHYY